MLRGYLRRFEWQNAQLEREVRLARLQDEILRVLDLGPATVDELADAIQTDPVTVIGATRRLEQRGLVVRSASSYRAADRPMP